MGTGSHPGEGAPMLIAGVVELPGEVVFAILAALMLAAVACCAIGGAIASAVAGERGVFWIGFVTCPAVTLLLIQAMPGELAVGAGLGAAALVGYVYRSTRRPPTDTN